MLDFEKIMQNKIVWFIFALLGFAILFIESMFYFAIADLVTSYWLDKVMQFFSN